MTERMTRAARALAILAVLGSSLAGSTPSASAAPAKAPAVLVVHRSNPVTNLSSAELRKILLGDETRWSGNQKITILLLPPGNEERRVVLERMLKMTDDDFVRHWISRVFQGEATSGPKTVSSPASIAKLVAGLPAAVGILALDEIPDPAEIKVLSIDGKAPGDAGYPLAR